MTTLSEQTVKHYPIEATAGSKNIEAYRFVASASPLSVLAAEAAENEAALRAAMPTKTGCGAPSFQRPDQDWVIGGTVWDLL